MRTKSLVLAAAAFSAGLLSVSAQVYSLNIVGYVNVPVPASSAYTIICNPLTAGGNLVSTVLTNAPSGLTLLTMSGGNYSQYDYQAGNPVGQRWYSLDLDDYVDNSLVLAPGEGFWVRQPGPATNITFVGEVKSGTNTVSVPAGYDLYGAMSPIGGNATTLGLTASLPKNDSISILKWAPGFSQYDLQPGPPVRWYSLDADDYIEPTIDVGAGFFIYNRGTATNWSQVFNP